MSKIHSKKLYKIQEEENCAFHEMIHPALFTHFSPTDHCFSLRENSLNSLLSNSQFFPSLSLDLSHLLALPFAKNKRFGWKLPHFITGEFVELNQQLRWYHGWHLFYVGIILQFHWAFAYNWTIIWTHFRRKEIRHGVNGEIWRLNFESPAFHGKIIFVPAFHE